MLSSFTPGIPGPANSVYPDIEQQLNPAFGQEAQSVLALDAASPSPLFSGTNYEVEGTDIGDDTAATMHQVVNMQGGSLSDAAMAAFVSESNASLFDTDMTSAAALARNARYADQIGTM